MLLCEIIQIYLLLWKIRVNKKKKNQDKSVLYLYSFAYMCSLRGHILWNYKFCPPGWHWHDSVARLEACMCTNYVNWREVCINPGLEFWNVQNFGYNKNLVTRLWTMCKLFVNSSEQCLTVRAMPWLSRTATNIVHEQLTANSQAVHD